MFPSTSEAIDAANTLKEFGKYLNSLRNETRETKEMKQILYKFNADGFITKCNQYREKFECPCPFGLYSLDELIEMILSGMITDSKTVAGIFAYQERKRKGDR